MPAAKKNMPRDSTRQNLLDVLDVLDVVGCPHVPPSRHWPTAIMPVNKGATTRKASR